MKKIYLDMAQDRGPMSVFIKDAEVFEAGTTISSMSAEEKNDEYAAYANDYDIHFLFDDDIVNIDFYTIPRVDIFAKDSSGGYIGTVGGISDIHSKLPICYIDKNKSAYLIADNLKELLKNSYWKEQQKPYDKIEFFSSKVDAQKKFQFVDIDALKN